jgi:hypothetical protein
MIIKTIISFTVCDDLLKSLHFQDDNQCRISSSEVMTVGLVAGLFYGGNIQTARKFLIFSNLIPKMISHSRLISRLLKIPQYVWQAAFYLIRQLLGIFKQSSDYIVDSCPLPVCLPCRSWRCKIYNGKEYLGFCAAKKLCYYGLKLHIVVNDNGFIMEFMFTPASWADIKALKNMELDLPPSYLFGDKAYTSYEFEEELINEGIRLIPQRKRNHKRQHSGALNYLLKARRKIVETVFSNITRLFPKSMSVRTSAGFELRMMLFILAYLVNKLSIVTI